MGPIDLLPKFLDFVALYKLVLRYNVVFGSLLSSSFGCERKEPLTGLMLVHFSAFSSFAFILFILLLFYHYNVFHF